jgi:hypothetical protein
LSHTQKDRQEGEEEKKRLLKTAMTNALRPRGGLNAHLSSTLHAPLIEWSDLH